MADIRLPMSEVGSNACTAVT